MAPPRKKMAPLFRQLAARCRERRRRRRKPSSLETYDIYMRNRLMPHFGKLRLDAIDHARVSAWFDPASVDKPGAANRAFEILRAMLRTARQWGDIGANPSPTPAPTSSGTGAGPSPAASIIRNSNALERCWIAARRNIRGRWRSSAC